MVRCCVDDEGSGASESPCGGRLQNRLMLRWLTTVVVSDEEKAPSRCQVGIGKANASESAVTCRNLNRRHQNRGVGKIPGMSLADVPLTGQVVSGL